MVKRVLGAVVALLVLGGLGALIWQAKDWGNLALVLVGMICISITVLLADRLANIIERALLPWQRGGRH